MSRKGVFALGALGGALPILASLITADLASLIDHADKLTVGNYVGYSIRSIALVVLGGVIAVLNTEVQQPLALVQLGIAAPALVTSYINSTIPSPSAGHASLSIISPAQADQGYDHKNFVLAGGFLSDVLTGIGQSPSRIGANTNPSIVILSYPNTVATTPPPTSPAARGQFCVNAKGRFGPGPSNPVGQLCAVNLGGEPIVGKVSQ